MISNKKLSAVSALSLAAMAAALSAPVLYAGSGAGLWTARPPRREPTPGERMASVQRLQAAADRRAARNAKRIKAAGFGGRG